MQKQGLLIVVLCVLFLNCKPQQNLDTVIRYTDQNNNTYFITSEKVSYTPITPIESSSGTYSGGKKNTVKISEETFSKIRALSEEIVNDKKHHSVQRRMLTSVLNIHRGVKDTSEKIILLPSSKRTALEELLRSL